MNNIVKSNDVYHIKINEFYKEKMNKNVARPTDVVNTMSNDINTHCGDTENITKVILQFPDKPSDDTIIKQEVREILNKALFEQLENQTYKITL